MKVSINGVEALLESADNYLQINDISEADLCKIWQQLNADYASYDKWLCFRNVTVPTELLSKLGAKLEDDFTQMRLYPDKIINQPHSPIEQMTDKTFDEFATFHDSRISNIYWTGERLKRDMDSWGIFCIRHEGQIAVYTIISMQHTEIAEIFCVESKDNAKELIHHASNYAFKNGKTEVLINVDNDLLRQAATLVGFAATGFYKGYVIRRS